MTSPAAGHLLVRLARPSDAEAVRDVHVASIRRLCAADCTEAQIDAWARPAPLADYRAAIQGSPFFVAEFGRELAGFSEVDLGRAEVKAVYVHPDHVRRGAGLALMAQLEAAARDAQCGELWLDSSLTAVSFYEATGFTVVRSMTHQLASGPIIPCVRMSKTL